MTRPGPKSKKEINLNIIQGQMCALGKSNSTLKETHEEHGCVQEDNETKEMSNSSTTLQKRNRRYIIAEEKQKIHYHRRNTGKLLHEDSRCWGGGKL